MGALLALGFAARAPSLVGRALAGAALPLLFSTIYFTFSRGAWIAAAIGLAIAVAADPRRLQLLLAGLVLAPASALAVLLSSHQDALTRTDAPLSAASDDGHRLAVYLLVLVGWLGARGTRPCARRTPRRSVRARRDSRSPARSSSSRSLPCLLSSSATAGPVTLARKGYDAFTTTSGSTPVDLNETALHVFRELPDGALARPPGTTTAANPVLGSGPGTYEQYWNEHRPIQHKVRDAHNLYLEVLAELGPLGPDPARARARGTRCWRCGGPGGHPLRSDRTRGLLRHFSCTRPSTGTGSSTAVTAISGSRAGFCALAATRWGAKEAFLPRGRLSARFGVT